MSKRRIVTVLILLVLVVAWGVAPAVIQYFATQALLKAKADGLQLDVDELKGERIGFSALGIAGWFPVKLGRVALPLNYKLDQVDLRLKLLNWPPSPRLDIAGRGYGGDLVASVSGVLGSPLVDMNLAGVDLSSHPQINAAGLSAGRLSLEATHHPLRMNWAREASYTLNISELQIELPSIARDLTKISSISDGNLSARAVVKSGGSFEIVSSDLKSSLFSAKLTGRGKIAPNGELSGVSGMLRVALDQPDSQSLAAWLPLITNQQVEANSTKFGCVIQSGSCSMGGAISLKLGRECLRLVCNQ